MTTYSFPKIAGGNPGQATWVLLFRTWVPIVPLINPRCRIPCPWSSALWEFSGLPDLVTGSLQVISEALSFSYPLRKDTAPFLPLGLRPLHPLKGKRFHEENCRQRSAGFTLRIEVSSTHRPAAGCPLTSVLRPFNKAWWLEVHSGERGTTQWRERRELVV